MALLSIGKKRMEKKMEIKYDLTTEEGRKDAMKKIASAGAVAGALVGQPIISAAAVLAGAILSSDRKTDGQAQVDLAKRIVESAKPGDEIELELATGTGDIVKSMLGEYGELAVSPAAEDKIKVAIKREDTEEKKLQAMLNSMTSTERFIYDVLEKRIGELESRVETLEDAVDELQSQVV